MRLERDGAKVEVLDGVIGQEGRGALEAVLLAEDEEVAHGVVVALLAAERAGVRLDAGVARDEQQRDLGERGGGVVAVGEAAVLDLAQDGLVGDGAVVEEEEGQHALLPAEGQQEVVLLAVHAVGRRAVDVGVDDHLVGVAVVDGGGAEQHGQRQRVHAQQALLGDGEGIVRVDEDGGQRGQEQDAGEDAVVQRVARVAAHVLYA